MKIESKYPFEQFNCYLNLHKKENRMQVCLVNRETKQRRTILYSKYLMSIKLGRILSKEEEVDHIDGDKRNDSESNLQILTRRENSRKSLMIGRTYLNLRCCLCGKEFSRERRHMTHRPKSNKIYCSRACFKARN